MSDLDHSTQSLLAKIKQNPDCTYYYYSNVFMGTKFILRDKYKKKLHICHYAQAKECMQICVDNNVKFEENLD